MERQISQKAFWSFGWVDPPVLPDSLEITFFGTKTAGVFCWCQVKITSFNPKKRRNNSVKSVHSVAIRKKYPGKIQNILLKYGWKKMQFSCTWLCGWVLKKIRKWNQSTYPLDTLLSKEKTWKGLDFLTQIEFRIFNLLAFTFLFQNVNFLSFSTFL